MTPAAVAGAVFLAAAVVVVVPVIGFASLPVGFFSPSLLLAAGAVGFLAGAAALLFTAAGTVFFATPLVWGLDTPFERRLWDVLGRDPSVVLVEPVGPGFVLAVALLVGWALESPDVLFVVLAAGVSFAGSGFGSAWSISAAGCCGISPSAGLAAWLGSCPAASFAGLDSIVSMGSNATRATPSGFIAP